MLINNKGLLHQLKEHFGNSVPIDLLPFLVEVNDVYNDNESLPKLYNDGLVKVKNKTKTASDCERLRLHFSIVQQTAKTGSWEFDFPEHTSKEHKMPSDSHVYYFSDEIYRILGLEPGSVEISKDFFFPQLNPYDLSLILENSSGESRDIKQYEEEHIVTMNDGTERVILKKSDIFFAKNSYSPTKIIGTLQDITEKRTLENDLHKAKREKQAVLQSLFNAYLSYDVVNNKVLFSNFAFQKLFEDTPLQNKSGETSFLSLIAEEDKTGTYSLLRKLAKGSPAPYNFRIRLNDGGYRWIESRLVPTLGRDGGLKRIELIANDVTTLKKTDNNVKQLQQELQKQLFSVGEVVMMVNDTLALSYVSENVNRLLGFMQEDITGLALEEIVYPEDIESAVSFYKNILNGKNSANRLAVRFMNKNGDAVWCECEVHNISGNSMVGGVLTRVRDATFFKEQESKLIASADELKKINANLEDFVSVVSHDLRAPLSSMKGILDIIDLKESSADLADELQYLRGSVDKLDSFIVELLDYSRCTKGELKPQQISLEEILEGTANDLRFMNAQNTTVLFKKEVTTQGVFYSDPKMIRIILNNLISNAIRYSDPATDEPFVSVQITATEINARIEVTDNGIGISKEDQEKVFDMFYRVADDSNGTGMGLHLVKLAVEKLSGEIRIESEQNKGTRFSILIPNMLNIQN